MEERYKYALLLERGGEDIAMAAAKYLYLLGNYGEPWTTGVRNACLTLEKLDFAEERQRANRLANKQQMIWGITSILYTHKHSH